jgi:phosphoglycolate phosphatase
MILIFDLDGTLVDSAPDLAAALNATLAAAGRQAVTPAAVRKMIGDGIAKLVERGFAATGAVPPAPEFAARLAEFSAIYQARSIELTRPYPGVEATLALLVGRGHRLGVCTNKPNAATRIVLEGLGLARHIEAFVGGDTAPARKPDPRHYIATLDALGAGRARSVMIGDSEVDVALARAAGVPAIVVSHGYARTDPRSLGADFVIDGMAELPAILDRLAPD